MLLTERIQLLADKYKYTFASIERDIGLGRGTIRKWDSNIPSADKLAKVAKLLMTTSEWLLTGEENEWLREPPINSQSASIITEQSLLLDNFKKLSEEGQQNLIKHSIELLENEEIVTIQVAARGNSKQELTLTRGQLKELAKAAERTNKDDLKGLF